MSGGHNYTRAGGLAAALDEAQVAQTALESIIQVSGSIKPCSFSQAFECLIESSAINQVAKALIHGRPGTDPSGISRQAAARAHNPKDAAEHQTIINSRTPAAAELSEEIGNQIPSFAGEFVPFCGRGLLALMAADSTEIDTRDSHTLGSQGSAAFALLCRLLDPSEYSSTMGSTGS